MTDATDTRPQAIQYLPTPTYVPLWAALATLAAAVGVLRKDYIVAGFGCLVLAISLVIWLRPRGNLLKMLHESDLPAKTGLPVLASGTAAVGWWGMVGLLTILGSSFTALFYSYFYIRLFSEQWPQDELARPGLWLAGPGYAALLIAGIVQSWSMRCFRREQPRGARFGFLATLLAGGLFLGLQILDWLGTPFTPQTNAYGSLFWLISGATVLLAVVGLAVAGAGLLRVPRSDPRDRAHLTLHLEAATLYWAFTAVVGLFVFATLYLSPYLL